MKRTKFKVGYNPPKLKLFSSPHKVCNWTLQRKVKGFPKCYLKSDGFRRLTKDLLGLKFFKQRNDQLDFNINLNDFVKRDCNIHINLKRPIIKVILSNCTDDSILIKIIGVKIRKKVDYGFKIVQEIFGNLINPETGRKIKGDLEYIEIITTNIVVTWSLPEYLLMDLKLMKMKSNKNFSYRSAKIPLLFIRFTDPKFVCIVSQGGKCTVPGLKPTHNIREVQKKVEDEFLKMWDERSLKEFYKRFEREKKSKLPQNVNDDVEIEEAKSDYLHFIKNESYFYLINENGRKVKPPKYFNKSDFKKPKKKLEQRLNSISSIDTETIPTQDIQFYFEHKQIFQNQCSFI